MILGDLQDRTVVELGCGSGHNLAYLVAHCGAIGVGVGVDHDPAKITRATAAYGRLPAIRFILADAVDHLTCLAPASVDVCLSMREVARIGDRNPRSSWTFGGLTEAYPRDASARSASPTPAHCWARPAEHDAQAGRSPSRCASTTIATACSSSADADPASREHAMFLFCDIDGVLIPFPRADGGIPHTHRPDQVLPAGYDEPVSIWLNPAHGPMLAELVATTGLEAVWCSSWRADAARLIGPRIGLPPWPHVDLPRLSLTSSHPNGYLWKRDHVAAYAGRHAFAWIDDDLTPADHRWAATRTAAGYPSLLIQPDSYVGVTIQLVGLGEAVGDCGGCWVSGRGVASVAAVGG